MPDFAGSLYNNAGVARDTAADTVAIFTDATEATDSTGTGSATALTQTDASGDWSSLSVADGIYDVRITDGSSIRWRRYNDRVQLREMWVGELSVVNQTNAASNQILLLRGNNSTRAANDEIYVSMSMEDSAGNETEFARLTTLAVDVTNTSEDGRVEIDTMIAGTLTRTHYFEGRTIVIDQVTGDVTLSFPDPAANVTVTFPNTTDTLVARATTDTLTNKTLTTPTIAATGWANATHTHTAASSGGLVVAASDTQVGALEVATIAETNTGTDATRAVSPDGLAGSVMGEVVVQLVVTDFATEVPAIGDGKFYFHVDSKLNGMDLVRVHAGVITAGTTGTMDIQIARESATHTLPADMLSTKITIDSTEIGSDTAAVAAVINAANDDVSTNQWIRVDLDAVQTTKAKGLIITLVFRLP